MIKKGDTVLYIGEYDNCHNIEYLVTKVYQEGYYNIIAKDEFYTLGVYREIYSVQVNELIKVDIPQEIKTAGTVLYENGINTIEINDEFNTSVLKAMEVLNQCNKCFRPFWNDCKTTAIPQLCSCVYVSADIDVHNKIQQLEEENKKLKDEIDAYKMVIHVAHERVKKILDIVLSPAQAYKDLEAELKELENIK